MNILLLAISILLAMIGLFLLHRLHKLGYALSMETIDYPRGVLLFVLHMVAVVLLAAAIETLLGWGHIIGSSPGLILGSFFSGRIRGHTAWILLRKTGR
ncbi:hypothetical protein A3A71_00320 [Candidatus Berkelbacteria bacterium RIFCSPLOWO2_01_FULL_50_28]|uniref:Uncharacterized protein n=1 Tax=Candidatus Berkelbacteria bacterium RIFCSPLOWO2_01_FULL_50_28 TaxID=1797471 RepID=A0A1F5EAT7_9BACT|nr:MAG: hypothetical protein A2807_02280 [Candidatus Berkelbacteria bacterium RIFCSPHIGHO2_01_FULL_50_36]OGD63546.1 MAG: hypothetical protein A3F39_02470 [Candidatus Berkelbacteria bacterium RIFCSPHIGHO2_12_FULL_50_11]OGD64493.1 MAG: hypothetical protein A3A71_00320 [Candidatus Berkelbacteria bacterium RIFCSPLOWO2_01_FULL_50_28]